MKKMLNYLKSNAIIIVSIMLVIIPVTAFGIIGTVGDNGRVSLTGEQTSSPDGYNEFKCIQETATTNGLALDTIQDAGSGCTPTEIEQLGSIPYYSVDVSTPTAFYNAVNGRGFNEGYGMQCVAGFKQFMFALSGRYVATKTGGASGYASQQAQIEPLGFTWHGGTSGLQDGDWGIFNNGTYGHVAMYYQGKWFGQNQGASNASIGNAFNLMNLGVSPVGYYRPNIYQKTEPTPTPIPTPDADTSDSSSSVTTDSYTVVKGDTLGGISLKLGWWVDVNTLYGDNGYTQRLAEKNGIVNRGQIYPNQVVVKSE